MENLDLDFGEQGNMAFYFREQGNEGPKMGDHFREKRTSEIKGKGTQKYN